VWNSTTDAGGTIKAACDFTINVPPGEEEPTELYPSVAAMHFIYGEDKYVDFLQQADDGYTGQPYYFWNQHPASLASQPSDNTTDGGLSRTTTSDNSAIRSRFDFASGAPAVLTVGLFLGFMWI
jgi:hypothetical protein